MNIDKFKRQHTAILAGISRLRSLAHAGIADNAADIARQIVDISGIVKLHLSIEDGLLYPELARSGDQRLARLGQQYQHEMAGIAQEYFDFVMAWNTADRVRADPERFRVHANKALRILYERMRREDREFYPAVEAAAAAGGMEKPGV
jgi:hypothetical protein